MLEKLLQVLAGWVGGHVTGGTWAPGGIGIGPGPGCGEGLIHVPDLYTALAWVPWRRDIRMYIYIFVYVCIYQLTC